MEQELVLAGAHDDAIVEQEAVLVAHQAVAAAARLQARHHVGVDQVEELARIRALDRDLAQGRGVEQADLLTRVEDFAGYGGVAVLALAAVAVGALPVADRLEVAAVIGVPLVHR